MGVTRLTLIVMVMVTIMVMMMVMIAISIMIVMTFGIARGVIVAVISLVEVMTALVLEGKKAAVATCERGLLTFQQLPHLFLLPFLQIKACLGVAAAGGFALLHGFRMLPL